MGYSEISEYESLSSKLFTLNDIFDKKKNSICKTSPKHYFRDELSLKLNFGR